MPDKHSLVHQTAECGFQGIRAGPVLPHHVTVGHAAMLAGIVQDHDGQLWQFCKGAFLALDLVGQAALLVLQGSHEEHPASSEET